MVESHCQNTPGHKQILIPRVPPITQMTNLYRSARHSLCLVVDATLIVELRQTLRDDADGWVRGVGVGLEGFETLEQEVLGTFVVSLQQAQPPKNPQHVCMPAYQPSR